MVESIPAKPADFQRVRLFRQGTSGLKGEVGRDSGMNNQATSSESTSGDEIYDVERDELFYQLEYTRDDIKSDYVDYRGSPATVDLLDLFPECPVGDVPYPRRLSL
ncbi:hypothetical protein Neosp_012483 [[Neocosmospora] mangrovei]